MRSLYVNLVTLDDVRAAVTEAYRQATGSPSPRSGTRGGGLSPQVADPSALMLRAVEIAGRDGLTPQQLRDVFGLMGQERYNDALRGVRESGAVAEVNERRPNRVGRLQQQVVLRPT